MPQTPPADPFALSSQTGLCTSDGVARVRQLAGELKAYVAQIEAARTAAGYPATMAAPSLADATVTYHGLTTTYALAIAPKGTGMLRALAGCMTLHIARGDDVSQRKLYAPASGLFFAPQLNFMPAVGLYFVARPPQAGQEAFRVYKLPTTPPKDAFEIRTSTSCVAEARNLATPALNELKAHFANGATTASWTIRVHPAKSGTWYELDPGDATVIRAIMLCGRVAGTTTDELEQRGYDGKPVPDLNYAPGLGLYLVRPAPRSSPSPSP